MQEYRLRLLLLDRGGGGQPSLAMAPPPPLAGIATTVSPPPTYRSHVGSMLRYYTIHIIFLITALLHV
jgi:hypothetical protein